MRSSISSRRWSTRWFGSWNGARVTQHVKRDVLLNGRATERRQKDVAAHVRLAEALADVADEERSRMRSSRHARLADVALDEPGSESAQRHHAILLAFALSQPHSTAEH